MFITSLNLNYLHTGNVNQEMKCVLLHNMKMIESVAIKSTTTNVLLLNLAFTSLRLNYFVFTGYMT